jgi:hypothetical protein
MVMDMMCNRQQSSRGSAASCVEAVLPQHMINNLSWDGGLIFELEGTSLQAPAKMQIAQHAASVSLKEPLSFF